MRRPALAIYGLLIAAEIVSWAIVPLAPRFRTELGLTKVEVGAILATVSVLSIAVSVPVGVWADRLGARALTLGSGIAIAAGSVAQGLASDFWSLLGARALFGVGFATVWTAGLALLAEVVPSGRRATALGATTATAGLGGLIGPAATGFLAERFGMLIPFAAFGSAALLVCAALLALRPAGELPERHHRAARDTYRLARRDRAVVAAIVATVLGGLAAGTVNLLVPLQLDENGLSEALIGIVFSAGAALFLVASATVARLADRTARVNAVGATALALACVLGIVLASPATAAVVAFLLLRAPVLAILFTVAFPLAAAGARRAGIGAGAVVGLLNVLWGVATVVAPLGAGALAELAGDRWAYAAVAVACAAAAAWALPHSNPFGLGRRPALRSAHLERAGDVGEREQSDEPAVLEHERPPRRPLGER